MPNPDLGTPPPPKKKQTLPTRILWDRILLVVVPVVLLLLPFYLDWWESKAAHREANRARIIRKAWEGTQGSLVRIPPGAVVEFRYTPEGLVLQISREPLSGSQKEEKD